MGLAGRTARGAVINMAAIVARIVVNSLIVLPILARLIGPEGFGLAAMALTLMAILLVFNDIGISVALVRHPDPSPHLWAAAFWTNLGLGLAMAALSFLSAPVLASFYRAPEVAELTRLASVIMLLTALYLGPAGRLQRDGRFGAIAMIDLAATLGSAIVAVSLALQGFGVWALIWQQVATAAIKLAGGMILAWPPVQRAPDWAGLRDVLPFSLRMTANSVVTFLNRNADNILIGRYLGADALGLYGRAYQLMLLPQQVIGQGAGFAIFPALNAAGEDLARKARMFLRIVRILALVTLPLLLGLAVLAEPFVRLLLGSQWVALAPTLSLLALAGLVQTLNGPVSVLWTSLGEAKVLLRWSLIRLPVYLAAFACGVWAGSTVVLAGLYAAANFAMSGPFTAEALRRIDVTRAEYYRAVLPSLVAAVIMAVGLAGLGALDLWPSETVAALPRALWFLALVGAGMALYMAVLALAFRPHLRLCLTELSALRRDRDAG